jgi:CHAD domain-containing protein
MFARTPLQFAAENVRLIRQQRNGVRDGDAESIHQASIATRRARAALKIVDGKQTERFELCATKKLRYTIEVADATGVHGLDAGREGSRA